MIPVERIQGYLRESAAQRYDTVELPPFTLYFHPSDPFPHFSYAIPDRPVTGEAAAAVRQLIEHFQARGRQPRLEFIEAFAPSLPSLLERTGLVEETRQHFMLCTKETSHPAPGVQGLTITRLDRNAPLSELRAFLTVQHRGFSASDTGEATERDAEAFRPTLHHATAFLGRLNGEAAGALLFTAPLDGIVELTGIATVAPHRRKGIASALTAHAVREAFTQGAAVASLSAADNRAGRVYERVGFYPFATMLAYSIAP